LKLEPNVFCEPYHHEGIHGEWIIPKSKHTSTILYLHGGGYCLGSMTTHRAYLTYLSAITNARIFHLDYRLAPEHPFPAALDDALEAYVWLVKQQTNLPLFIAGDSAGGGLALATLLALKKRKYKLPSGTICFSPWADLTHQGETLKTNYKTDHLLFAPSLPVVAKLYIRDADATNPYISPVYGDFKDVTPVFIQAGEGEILLSDSLRIFENIQSHNGIVTLEIWQNVFHAWPYAISLLSEAKQAILHVKDFIEPN
jgi:acetyl esterase/lipase